MNTLHVLFMIQLIALKAACKNAQDECEPVVGECSDQPYEYTKPSEDYSIQSKADPMIQLFDGLLNIPCSNYFKLFLCLKYKPPCLKTQGKQNLFVKPCRSMCEHVYSLCFPYMKSRGNEWNSDLDCSHFPPEDNNSTCIFHHGYPQDDGLPSLNNKKLNIHSSATTSYNDPMTNSKYVCFFKEKDEYISSNNYRCVPKCGTDIWFNRSEKHFVRLIITCSSIVCILSCLLGVCLFSRNKSNLFVYPEICLVYMIVCYVIYSFVYLVSLQISNKLISCRNIIPDENTINISSTHYHSILKSIYVPLCNINENNFCAIIFTLLNFCKVSILMWWLMLTFLLFLINFIQFDIFEIKLKLSKYFHMVAWISPAVHTFFILIRNEADISEFTGLCTVGNRDPISLLSYIILPTVSILAIGVTFIFLSLYKISFVKVKDFDLKNINKNSTKFFRSINKYPLYASKTSSSSLLLPLDALVNKPSKNKLREPAAISSRSMPRIYFELYKKQFDLAIFAIVFVIPIAIALCCEFYEYLNMSFWSNKYTRLDFHNRLTLSANLNDQHTLMPNFSIFILKYFMIFTSGVTLGVYTCVFNNLGVYLKKLLFTKRDKLNKKNISKNPLGNRKLNNYTNSYSLNDVSRYAPDVIQYKRQTSAYTH